MWAVARKKNENKSSGPPPPSDRELVVAQQDPPLAAQACFLTPMDTMKKIKADGDVGSLPLLPFAAMAGARALSP